MPPSLFKDVRQNCLNHWRTIQKQFFSTFQISCFLERIYYFEKKMEISKLSPNFWDKVMFLLKLLLKTPFNSLNKFDEKCNEENWEKFKKLEISCQTFSRCPITRKFGSFVSLRSKFSKRNNHSLSSLGKIFILWKKMFLQFSPFLGLWRIQRFIPKLIGFSTRIKYFKLEISLSINFFLKSRESNVLVLYSSF